MRAPARRRRSCRSAAPVPAPRSIAGMATHSATTHTIMRMKLCSSAHRYRSRLQPRDVHLSVAHVADAVDEDRFDLHAARRDRPRARSCRSRSRGRARRNAAPLRRARLRCDGSPLVARRLRRARRIDEAIGRGLRAHGQQQRCEIGVVHCFHGQLRPQTPIQSLSRLSVLSSMRTRLRGYAVLSSSSRRQ